MLPEATSGPSKKMLWTGRIISGLMVAFLVFDAVIKILRMPFVLQSFRDLGYPESISAGLGIVLLTCVILYVVPKTSVLGAILLTGYLGGAVATHVRLQQPWLSHSLFPIYVGVFLWGGLVLREPRLRSLIPLKS